MKNAVSKQHMADTLEISRPTLDKRIKDHKWKFSQISTIKVFGWQKILGLKTK